MNKALATAVTLGRGTTTPPGYPPGTVAFPGKTLILVSATTAPRSYSFSYSSQAIRNGNGTNAHDYNVAPVTTYAEPSDTGAGEMDALIYKALRVSGLPTIKLPANDSNGNPITQNMEYDLLTAFVTSLMPTVGIPGTLKTLPGLANWTRFPSLEVVYQGKSYTLYDGSEVTIQFSDGSTITLLVTVGGYGGSPGIFRVKAGSAKAAPAPVPAPPTSMPATGLNTLDPYMSSSASS